MEFVISVISVVRRRQVLLRERREREMEGARQYSFWVMTCLSSLLFMFSQWHGYDIVIMRERWWEILLTHHKNNLIFCPSETRSQHFAKFKLTRPSVSQNKRPDINKGQGQYFFAHRRQPSARSRHCNLCVESLATNQLFLLLRSLPLTSLTPSLQIN